MAAKAQIAPGSCPLGLDVNAALKSAAVAGTATPAGGGDSVTRAVDAESATNSGDGTALKKLGGGSISCGYALSGGGSLVATLAGVHTGRAINLIVPRVQRDGLLGVDDLKAFLQQKLDPGKTVLTPAGGLAAVTTLKASGGDMLFEVTTQSDDRNADHGPIVGEPLRKLAEELGKQARV